MSRHIYTLKKPAGWHNALWREALPLGNGLTGVLIPGGIAKESFTFNRFDLWERGTDREIPDISDTFNEMRCMLDAGDYNSANKENLAAALREKEYATPAGCPHPLGWLEMDYAPTATFKHYRRGVNMQTGEAFVEFDEDGCHYRRDAFVSRDADVTVIRMTAERPFTTLYDFRLYNQVAEAETTANSLYRASADGYSKAQVAFVGNYTSRVENDKLAITGADYMVLVRCGSHGSDCTLDAVLGKTYGELLQAHIALHQTLYDLVSIELAPEEAFETTNEAMLADAYDGEASIALLERLWRFGRYLFISATSEKGNPVPLYGLWHGDQNLPWSQYVANENVQITYWHAMAGGLAYSVLPLLRYYTAKADKLRECAQKMFGMRGIWISAYTAPNSSGPCVPAAVILNWISCAGWLCRHFWEYYLYTLDETLLREEILPFMYEAALFYRDYAVEDGNYIRLYPSVSPENTPVGKPGFVAQNATMDFAVMKELLTNLLCGMEITGMYAKEEASFRSLLSKIPPYMINEDGAIKEWMHPDIQDNYDHRHLSHIYPVFPGNEITAHNEPELFKAFMRAVDLRMLGAQTGWSMTHMSSVYARMGEGEKSVQCLDLMAQSVIMDSLLTTHNDWRNMGTGVYWTNHAYVQLDAAFGIVNAMQEMLFCAQNNALSILPALPKRFPSGSVKGLVFPQGTVDIIWQKNGMVTVTVKANRPIDTSVLLRGKEVCRLTLAAGECKTLQV